MKFEFAVMFPKSLNTFVSHSFFRSYFVGGKASPTQRATSNKVTLKESQPTLSLGPWQSHGYWQYITKQIRMHALWAVLARPVASSHIGSDAKCAMVVSRVTQKWVGVTERAVSQGALCLRIRLWTKSLFIQIPALSHINWVSQSSQFNTCCLCFLATLRVGKTDDAKYSEQALQHSTCKAQPVGYSFKIHMVVIS